MSPKLIDHYEYKINKKKKSNSDDVILPKSQNRKDLSECLKSIEKCALVFPKVVIQTYLERLKERNM